MGFKKTDHHCALFQALERLVIGAAHAEQGVCAFDGVGAGGEFRSGGLIGGVGIGGALAGALLDRDLRPGLDQRLTGSPPVEDIFVRTSQITPFRR